ncbi:MAG: Lar family restriction alleviation protein [Frisingicoccus sp.]|uniref:Lar family restriction alleviation protein n=1 Tax=Frisingicoccus sp. TaxID=1918627 RepID=UPI002A8327ED|nr:Lar family restriction alleviation protein [Frisingicoccus sp.]MDY4835568.1 Lar family restriction alleviation protein [Frisingicoccus sp.]
MENANKTKFKACPFCGKQATIKVNASTLNAYVHCENCSVTMKKNYKGTTRIEEVLIELIATDWNRRSDDGLSGSD